MPDPILALRIRDRAAECRRMALRLRGLAKSLEEIRRRAPDPHVASALTAVRAALAHLEKAAAHLERAKRPPREEGEHA